MSRPRFPRRIASAPTRWSCRHRCGLPSAFRRGSLRRYRSVWILAASDLLFIVVVPWFPIGLAVPIGHHVDHDDDHQSQPGGRNDDDLNRRYLDHRPRLPPLFVIGLTLAILLRRSAFDGFGAFLILFSR